MKESQRNMKQQFDKKRRNPQGLKAGDHVLLENKNIHLNRPSKKLDNKRYGLFKILKNIGSGAFELELPEEWMIHNIFNEDLLTLMCGAEVLESTQGSSTSAYNY